MPCNLTQNMTIDCKDSIGGTKEVLFIEFDNVTAITEASGVVTTITVATGKQFRRYVLPKETGFWTETPNSNTQNGTLFYQQELTVVINKMQANTRNELMLLAQNRLLAIALDLNGKYWLLGRERALDLSGGDGGSGTATGDRNGYTRAFTGMERQMAPEVQSSIIAGLLTPAA
ncbi:hypothetical protein [Chitinophaga sp. sic0106]|uniref:hypothetical protein n=1 Tax=Chitinophaga sp. sic0106 TaxID=2854785 RepID=UPI001C47B54C|nr:hypothetical protein [Chitinophaga sp. sic0106]MBV7534048.1 hypothetical protein [Chitinophaga sp. sic0106]